jgi:hypothetical protein
MNILDEYVVASDSVVEENTVSEDGQNNEKDKGESISVLRV